MLWPTLAALATATPLAAALVLSTITAGALALALVGRDAGRWLWHWLGF